MNVHVAIILIAAIGCTSAVPIPSWGLGYGTADGPGWGGGIGGLYPGVSVPVGGYAGTSPIYAGTYSYSPSYPGYTPGLYGLPYLNFRG